MESTSHFRFRPCFGVWIKALPSMGLAFLDILQFKCFITLQNGLQSSAIVEYFGLFWAGNLHIQS